LGKFDDALKKARDAKGKPAGKPVSSKVVKMPLEAIDSLRLDTQAPEPVAPKRHPFNGRIDTRLVCLQDPSSPAAECFKVLRSKLLVGDSGELRRTIMVTSAEPADGKSLVSVNLAVSIAQGMNHYVLLVDCDLRRPSLHKSFGLRAGHGLREYLEEGNSIAPYLLKTPVGKLTLLPAGQPSSSPSELLGSEKMQLLIRELKGRYPDRFIILDSPPAHFTAEASSLFSMMDGVLLVVRSGKTSREPVQDVIANIGREKILGVVFNSSKEVQRDYRYYYRYYKRGGSD
jgi:exopolysaccharide/PEP-CTERM locus tyrosine autokinase